MKRFDDFLRTIDEKKLDLYIKGDMNKDADYWFEGISSFKPEMVSDPDQMESFIGLMVVTTAARMLKDYQKYLEENPE